MTPRALLIEPDPATRDSLRLCLACEGFRVSAIADPDGALARLAAEPFELVIVDHDVWRHGSRRFCAEIRRRASSPSLALVLLAAQTDRAVAIELLDDGLDAYVMKPVPVRELVARVRALLRRTAPQARPAGPATPVAEEAPVQVCDLDIDRARRRVRLQGEELRLTEQEFQLLYFLANRPGRVFDRQALLDALWGDEAHVTPRSVDTLVKRLRQRLRARAHRVDYVQTVRGVGYRFVDVDVDAAMTSRSLES